MIKRLISFFLTLVFLIAVPISAAYRYNPYTRKLDFYQDAGEIDLGDIGDITLTGLATGNILYYDGAAWVNLATGANAEVLTLAAGIPSWAAAPAPGAHAASHEVGGADLVDHDQLTNYLAAQHLTLPNTIVAVLTDHTQAAHNALLIDADTVDGEHAAAIVTNARVKAHFPDTIANVLSDHNLLAHTALGLFDQSSDVDHDATTNWVANKHIDWTAAADNFSTSEDFTLAWTEAADHASITQTAVAGIENQALIMITDDRVGATVDEAIEASLRISAAGSWALYIEDGDAQFGTISYFSGDTYQYEDVFMSWEDPADHVVISQGAVAGIEDVPLIGIDDDRTGATANEETEATIRIDADGTYALSLANGGLYLGGTAEFTAGTSINEYSIDGTLAGDSDDAVPTEKAVKTYVDVSSPFRNNLLTNSGFGVWSQSDTNKGLGTLVYDNLAGGNFAVGDTITGATSGAVGKLQTDNGATSMTIGAAAGRFHDNEQIGNGAGVTADVNMPDGAVGVDLVQNGEFSVDTDPPPGWTASAATLTTEAGGQIGNCIQVEAPGMATAFASQETITVIGKIYKLLIYFKKDDGQGRILLGTALFGNQIWDSGGIDDAAWTVYTHTFEATTTTTYITGKMNDSVTGRACWFDEISIYEITPCATAGDAVGLDGWEKDTTLDMYRQHNDGGTFTKDGSFYSVKCVPTVASDFLIWDSFNTKAEWTQQFAGRKVAVGVWAKTSTANHFRWVINDGAAVTSSYHTGGGAWEWIELTDDVNAAAAQMYFYFTFDAAPAVNGDTIAYLSQPMLAYGSAIGEGNYRPKSQEMIWLEKAIPSNVYHGLLDQSDIGFTDINIEADSDAMLPKGAKVLAVHTEVEDSGSGAGLDVHLELRNNATVGAYYCNSVAGKPNNVHSHQMGFQPCDVNGDIDIEIDASGASTFDITEFEYHGVQVN